MDNEILKRGLKGVVVHECGVEIASLDEIKDHDVIIGGEGALRLDSLDAVEIAAALERIFGLKLETTGVTRKIFKSFDYMAEYVRANAPAEKVQNFLDLQRIGQPSSKSGSASAGFLGT